MGMRTNGEALCWLMLVTTTIEHDTRCITLRGAWAELIA